MKQSRGPAHSSPQLVRALQQSTRTPRLLGEPVSFYSPSTSEFLVLADASVPADSAPRLMRSHFAIQTSGGAWDASGKRWKQRERWRRRRRAVVLRLSGTFPFITRTLVSGGLILML